MPKKEPAEKAVRDIRRKTRRITLLWAISAISLSGPASAQSLTCPEGTAERYEEIAGYTRTTWCELPSELGEGLKHGPYRSLFWDGTQRITGQYERGKKDGTWRSWHANGQQSSETSFVAGVLAGQMTVWGEDGRIRVEGGFRGGKRDGLWRNYYSNGQLSSETHYADGEKVGQYRSWYEDGQPAQVGAFLADKEDGPWTTWHRNGQKASEGVAQAGQRSDNWSFWAADGSRSTAPTISSGSSSQTPIQMIMNVVN